MLLSKQFPEQLTQLNSINKQQMESNL